MTWRITRRADGLGLMTGTLLALAVGPIALGGPAQVTGSLETIRGVRVLKLWGTAEQRGYAHGYLLGAEIMEVFEGVILSPNVMEDPRRYETEIRAKFLRKMRFSPEQRAELEGMLRGVVDAVGVEGTRLDQLNRNLDVRDLMAGNSFADWARFGCSSFSAWGEATAEGGTITARNLDFLVLPPLETLHVLIAHLEPGGGKPLTGGPSVKGKQRWVTVAWPSLIGAYTAMNEQGATISMHYGPGLEPTHTGAFVPSSLALREAMQTAGGATAVADVRRILASQPSMFGFNMHVSSPFAGQPDPAAVFEYDGDLSKDGGVTPRLSTAAPLKDWIACTNHYCRRGKPPTDLQESSLARYAAIEKALTEARQQHRKIDVPFAWQVIDSVGNENTLHSVVFLPNRKELHVKLARQGVPAMAAGPVRFELGELLRR